MMPMRDVRGVVRDVTADAPITVIDRGGQVINVKSCGVKGDGASDDTAALTDLVRHLKTGDTVFFPSGTYNLSSTISIGDGSTAGASSVSYVRFIGSGCGVDAGDLSPGDGASTIFQWVGGAGVPVFKANGPITVHFHDFDVRGTSTGSTCGDAFQLYYPMFSTMSRISIRRHGGLGVKLTSYASKPTGAANGACNNYLSQVFAHFGTGNSWGGIEIGEVGAGGDPVQMTAIGCVFGGSLNTAAITLRYTDNGSFHQCTATNYAHGPTLKIKPVTGQPLSPAEYAFYNCPLVGDSPCITVDETDQTWVPYLTGVGFWPFPVGDAGGVFPIRGDTRFCGFTDSGFTLGKDLTIDTHLMTSGSAPSATLLAGAGGVGAAATLYDATDTAGLLLIHTGAAPVAPDSLVRLDFTRAYPTRAQVVLTPGDRNAAALSGASQVVASGSTGSFSIITGTAALAAGTDYYWYYHVIGV